MKCLKRLLQGCICAATAISLTSGIAFAAESKELTTTSVAKVGDTYYDSLAEAVNAIETEGTIELVKDADQSSDPRGDQCEESTSGLERRAGDHDPACMRS